MANKKNYMSFEELPLALSAEDVAVALGISRAHSYALLHRKDFPKIVIGKRITVPKQAFIEWMQKQIG